jgi:hypothetical protein
MDDNIFNNYHGRFLNGDGEYKYINNTTNNYAKQDSDDINYTQLAIISLVCISSILGWIHKYYYNKK